MGQTGGGHDEATKSGADCSGPEERCAGLQQPCATGCPRCGWRHQGTAGAAALRLRGPRQARQLLWASHLLWKILKHSIRFYPVLYFQEVLNK